jgi:hypothetical protein
MSTDGGETFEQRRARYAKERATYVQAAKDRLGRTRPSGHVHDTWGECDVCLWYEVYPDGVCTEPGAVDIKTLVVGQKVYVKSGPFGGKGEVIRIMPNSVFVECGSPGVLEFGSNGRCPHDEGTDLGGPWELDDKPWD